MLLIYTNLTQRDYNSEKGFVQPETQLGQEVDDDEDDDELIHNQIKY